MKRSKEHASAGGSRSSKPITAELPERAPAGWGDIQKELADTAGLSMLLVEGRQPPAVTIANNNSICHVLQSSPDHVKLCDPFCGEAHARATSAGEIIHYRCHAGLQCFAMPVDLEAPRNLVAIGGRAFVHGADYRALVERVRSGDLQDLFSEEMFRNVIFADESSLDHAAVRLTQAVEAFKAEAGPKPTEETAPEELAAASIEPERFIEEPPQKLHARADDDERENEALLRRIRGFAEEIDATDPAQTYESIVAQSASLLHAERSSLLLLDESSNQLTMMAGVGIPTAISQVAPIAIGQGIAGTVLQENRPLLATVDASFPERRYKTKSFISYPIAIGERRFGVLNLADKADGSPYDVDDLRIMDLVAPQIALALERAVWQQRANQFQLMSITDPLTGLHNRRYLEARLTEEVSRSKRYNYPMSFMMIDIDDFKLYNDQNGHQAGDRALEMTAQCLRAALRRVDVASRYGGEEFSILLPQTGLEEAGAIADRIRRKIMSTNFPHGKTQPLGHVSVSIGLSTFSTSLDSAEAIVRAADRALYHAKRHGKNRAYAYQAPGSTDN